MANSPQAIKRARQAQKRSLQHTSQRSEARTAIKNILKALKDGKKEDAAKAYKTAVKTLDKIAGRGLIHPNKAARLKSRLNKKIQ